MTFDLHHGAGPGGPLSCATISHQIVTPVLDVLLHEIGATVVILAGDASRTVSSGSGGSMMCE
ncbi:hypothetical protein [Streptomyces sp. NPDC088847]|uniref:hypothetical protein n=1 Tax=Streptomyces sp. NPDC088847 TaxID=3365909 RepID=UPI0038177F5B